MAKHSRYLAYMVRLWQVGSEDGPAWRVALESPHTGERQVFVSLEALFAFLRAETTDPALPETPAQEIGHNPSVDHKSSTP